MFRHHRRVRAAALAMALTGALLTVGSSPAAAKSDSVSGRFDSVPVSGPQCPSPIAFCTQGNLSGGVAGSFTFVASSLITTVDSPTTSVVAYTGDIAISAKDGTLLCKDAGTMQTTGAGVIGGICVIISGTGGYAGATGYLQTFGTFSQTAGGSGRYTGSIVLS